MFCHKWSKNCKTTVPNHCIFFDTESELINTNNITVEMPLRLGWAIYRTFHKENKVDKREVHYFETQESFYNFVMSHISPKERLCLWAHNINHDLSAVSFYYHAFKDGWCSRVPYTKGMTFIDSISKDDMKIDILDTCNFFKCKLKDLGEAFDMPKGDVDWNTRPLTKELKDYCYRDTEIVEKTVSSYFLFLRDNDLGHFQRTIASQAFGTYRHRFMDGEVWTHTKKQPEKLERLSFFGGRVECFEIGDIKPPPIYKLDVNSMYPYIMHENKLPCAFKYVRKTMSISNLIKHFQKGYAITANCYIDTNEPIYPKKINNRLCFPIGKFWTTLSTPEIRHALLYDHLIKIDQIEIHKQDFIFKDYVSFLYNKRVEYKKADNKPYTLMVKYLLNSIFGKTGQLQRITIEKDISDLLKVDERIIMNGDTGEISTLITFGGRQINRTTTEKDAFNSYPAIAAHITAYARVYLYTLIKQAGRENCYYCDTDSLFTNEKGYNNLKEYLSDTELGLLKLEETLPYLKIYGNKDYTDGKKPTLKGVPKDAIKIAENTYQYYQWTKFHSVFKNGLKAPPMKTLVIKVLKRTYDKGIKLKSGRITPFILDEPIDTCPFSC